jgi:hypothetical protein
MNIYSHYHQALERLQGPKKVSMFMFQLERSYPLHTFHKYRPFANKWLQKVKRQHDKAKNWYDYS